MINLGDWAYWLLWIGVIAVMCALVYLAWWALFADRANGRRRCPKCWYDMAYAPPPGMRCPECGFTATREVQFTKTRRRYAVALGAVLVSVTIAIVVNEQVARRGVVGMLPTQALLWMLPLASDSSRGVFREILNRADAGELSDRQWTALLTRCAAGDWQARPTSEVWVWKYGSFVSAMRDRLTLQPELQQPLRTIPPRVKITAQEVWPAGVPVTVMVQIEEWWPGGTECRVRAQRRGDNAAPTVFYRPPGDWSLRTPFALTLPPLDDTAPSIELDVQIERRHRTLDVNGEFRESDEAETDAPEWEHAFAQTFTLPMAVGGTIETMHTPVSGAALDQDMARVLQHGAIKFEGGASPVRFSLSPQFTHSAPFQDTAIGITVELHRADEIARRLNVWWKGGVMHYTSQPGRQYGFEIAYENRALLMEADQDDERWSIVVRSDPALALRAGPATRYWQGEITLPMKLTLRTGAAPPRPWRTEPAEGE